MNSFMVCIVSGAYPRRDKRDLYPKIAIGHVEIARTCSKLVVDRFEAKFHYAIWSQTGPKLVADRFEAGRRPAAS